MPFFHSISSADIPYPCEAVLPGTTSSPFRQTVLGGLHRSLLPGTLHPGKTRALHDFHRSVLAFLSALLFPIISAGFGRMIQRRARVGWRTVSDRTAF